MSKQQKRTGLRQQLRVLRNPQCQLCSLNNSSTHVCVMGRGNPRARIVLIGEAPGEKEAETGLPFMGRAGQLLNETLRKAGICPDTGVYITNLNKCRPPKNRTPTILERNICAKNYLIPELSIVSPWIVVLLGRTASEWAFPQGFHRGVVNWHRGIVPSVSVPCVPTWHPAAYLHSHDESIKVQLLKHLKLAKSLREDCMKEWAQAQKELKTDG